METFGHGADGPVNDRWGAVVNCIWIRCSIVSTTVLSILGLAGNYYNLALFLGTQFLFGGTAGIVALMLCGFWPGLVVTAVASSYTYYLWGHPYAMLLILLEYIVVGQLYRSKRLNPVMMDIIFWLLAGPLFVWLFYNQVLHVDADTTLVILLKQGVNGVFNTSLGLFCVLCFRSTRWFRSPSQRMPLGEWIASMLICFVFMAAVVIMSVLSNITMEKLNQEVKRDISAFSTIAGSNAEDWLNSHVLAIMQLAEVGQEYGLTEKEILQLHTRMIKSTFPGFHSLYITDAAGNTVVFYPDGDAEGEQTTGLNFAGQPHYATQPEAGQPLLSNVISGRGDMPVSVVAVPLLNGGELNGYVLGAIDLQYLRRVIDTNIGEPGVSIAILDRQGHLAAQTDNTEVNLADYFSGEAGGTLSESFTGLVPQKEKMPFNELWKSAYYFQESRIANGWRVIVALPLKPYREMFFFIYSRALFAIFLIVVIAIITAHFLGRKLAGSFEQLARTTKLLGERIEQGDSIEWLESNIDEVNLLSNNFQHMAEVLKREFDALNREIKEKVRAQATLEKKNAELNAVLNELRETSAELKVAYTDLQNVKMQVMQREKMASIGQLAAGIAHEINNPLGFIQSNVDTLQKYTSTVIDTAVHCRNLLREIVQGKTIPVKDSMRHLYLLEVKHKLDDMLKDIDPLIEDTQTGVRRIGDIIKVLQLFSRADYHGKAEAYDLNEGVESSLISAREDINYAAKITVELSYLPPIQAIGRQINRAILNLLLNAAYAINAKGIDSGQISIRTFEDEEYVYCTVSDNGIGIPEKIRHAIFDPFFTTKPVGEGVGLGLSVAYDVIVSKHQGELCFESKEGIGTVFTIKLPKQAPDQFAEQTKRVQSLSN